MLVVNRGVRVLVVACVAAAALAVGAPATSGAGAAPDATSNPFAPTDTFCTKTGPAPTKGTIKVVQIRSQLEKYAPLGFSFEVGDVNDMFRVFTDQINACGGVRGQKVVLQNEEYNPTDPASLDAACIAATEDDKAFVVVNSNTLTGTGPFCVAGDHKTPLLYVGGAPDSEYQSTNGRLASYGPSADGQLRLLAGDLLATGAAKGKKVAIVATDLPDQVDVIQRALVDPLKKKGVNVVTYDVMPCQGSVICSQPIPQSVMKIASAKPDIVIPVLTATTLPAYINEMKRAGMTREALRVVVQRAGRGCRTGPGAAGGRAVAGRLLQGCDGRVGHRRWRLAAARLRAAADRRHVQRRVRQEHHDGRLVQTRHRGLHEVGRGGVGVHEHAHDGSARCTTPVPS